MEENITFENGDKLKKQNSDPKKTNCASPTNSINVNGEIKKKFFYFKIVSKVVFQMKQIGCVKIGKNYFRETR
jgi:hypothetical protein